MEVVRIWMGGKRVVISDKEITIILVLHLYSISYHTKIVPQVEITG
jgi:hypothetical protein